MGSHGGGARTAVAAFWNEVVERWLHGGDPMPDPLRAWFGSYRGAGDGEVTREALPEPWIGPLTGRPRLVVLGLNPGGADLSFQGREGLFAAELRTMGGYTHWAASSPYSRPPWTTLKGKNRYQDARVRFARRFYQDPDVTLNDVLAVELYPWHSRRVTADISVPVEVLERMVWSPLAEIDVADVFAFGRPWSAVAERAGLPLVDRLGRDGRPFGSDVESRRVDVHRLPSGQRLVVSSQLGYAGPPGAADTDRLREALVET